MSPLRPTLAGLLACLALGALPAPASAAPPANDAFADAQVLAPAGATVTGTNEDSSVEAGEPNHASSPYGEPFHSIWYAWTAPQDGPASVSTCGSAFDTRVAVYVGSSVSTLQPVTSSDSGQCAGSAFAEVAWTAEEGTTYRIAVDTNGGIDESGEPERTDETTGIVRLVLDGPGAEAPPRITEEAAKVTVPDLRPFCGTSGTKIEKCPDPRFYFTGKVLSWLKATRAAGGDVDLVVSAKPSSSQDGAVARYLRSSQAQGGEVLQQNLKPGVYFTTVDAPLTLKIGYFDLLADKAAHEATLALLEKAGKGKKEVASPCAYIATDASPEKIITELNRDLGKPGVLTQQDAGRILASRGCGYEVTEYFDVPGLSEDAVWAVTGVDRTRHLVQLKVGLPVAQDFLLVVREDPAFATTSMLGLGTDGKLTASSSQLSRITVQVVQRLTGQLVAGAEVSFVGVDGKPETQRTNAQGEWTFTSKLAVAGRYAVKALVQGANGARMTGYRSIDVVDRGTSSFVTMSGRTMTRTDGAWTGTQEEVDRARSLPVVPANLGTGIAGSPTAAPSIVQASAAFPNVDGTWTAGQTNSVQVPDDSSFAVGAAPGLIVIGGGLDGQVARAARGWPNPFQAVADAVNYICTGLAKAVEQGKGRVVQVASDVQRQAIATAAKVLTAQGAAVPPSSLISDKGLGLITDNGSSVISTGGLNVISTGGLNLRDAQGNLIGQAGGNLIGQAGGNVISTGGLNVISTGGLNMVPVSGGSLIGQAGGN